MEKIFFWLASVVDKAGQLLNFNSTAGSIALGLGIVIVAVIMISFIWKTVKKTVGTAIALILVIAILSGCGILTLGQVRNVLETSGVILDEGWSSATEEQGSAFIYWIQKLMDNDSSDVGGFDFSHEGGFLD